MQDRKRQDMKAYASTLKNFNTEFTEKTEITERTILHSMISFVFSRVLCGKNYFRLIRMGYEG